MFKYGDVSFMDDEMSKNIMEPTLAVITKDDCEFLKNYTPEKNKGFMYTPEEDKPTILKVIEEISYQIYLKIIQYKL